MNHNERLNALLTLDLAHAAQALDDAQGGKALTYLRCAVRTAKRLGASSRKTPCPYCLETGSAVVRCRNCHGAGEL